MPTVAEFSDPYANFLLPPASPGAEGVCSVCLTFTQGYTTCYRCGHQPRGADAVLPISYSIHMGQLHAALRGYKEGWRSARRLKGELAAVLWRFLARHEACLARRVGVERFDAVTTVPSSDRERDASHPLHDIVGRIVRPTADRHERMLWRSTEEVEPRQVDVRRYAATRAFVGENVLLIDDTWTTGASVQSAALALKAAGVGLVGVVVIGRHIREDYEDNEERLRALPRFSWERCAFE
jgi:predicted amidophosphoribosyltransferase